MFHFGKKKASVPELVLSAENIELYRGPLSDIPLSEKSDKNVKEMCQKCEKYVAK